MILPGTLIDGLDSGVIMLGPDGRIQVWNAWIAARSDIAATTAVGSELETVFPTLRDSHLSRAVQRALHNGLSTVMSHNLHPRVLPLFSRHGGQPEPVEQSVVVRPLVSDDGPPGCLIQVSDITAAVRRDRHLREVTVYNRTLFEMAVDPMAIVAADGTLIEINPAFAHASGMPRHNIAGAAFPSLFTKPAEAQELISTAMAASRAADVLLTIDCGNGTQRHLSFTAATVPGRSEGGTVVFLVARDLTERIEAARELVAKTRIVERSNAELEQFAYVVSHDLRQPLRTVNSFLGLIRQRLGENIDGELAEFIGFAVDGAKRMDRLIVDLLNYALVGRQDAAFQRVNLGEALEDAAANLASVVREAGAELTVRDTLPSVDGCRSELVRLFQNLLANAIAYAVPGQHPRIEITCRAQAAGWVVAVRDNGVGIAAKDADRVFDLFQRLPSGNGNAEGSGIGLAVCRKIVERHRGRIWVESQPGLGSTFMFSLPREEN